MWFVSKSDVLRIFVGNNDDNDNGENDGDSDDGDNDDDVGDGDGDVSSAQFGIQSMTKVK